MVDRMVVEEITKELEKKNKVVGKTNNDIRDTPQTKGALKKKNNNATDENGTTSINNLI